MTVAHAQNILPDRHVTVVISGHVTDVTSSHLTAGHVTSGSSTASLYRKCGLSCTHILLGGYNKNVDTIITLVHISKLGHTTKV
jgi:hypothetical protein